jgi:hypothetical protein
MNLLKIEKYGSTDFPSMTANFEPLKFRLQCLLVTLFSLGILILSCLRRFILGFESAFLAIGGRRLLTWPKTGYRVRKMRSRPL